MPHLKKRLNFPLPQLVSSDLDQKPRHVAWWRALPPVGLSSGGRWVLSLRKWRLPSTGHSDGTDPVPAEDNLVLTISGLSFTCSKEG